ncbi:hypothetical protein D3C81_2145270 [compost metagenome]
MALTLYVAQFVLAWVLITADINYYIGEIPFGDGIVVLITLTAGWLRVRFSHAPLEILMRRFDRLIQRIQNN